MALDLRSLVFHFSWARAKDNHVLKVVNNQESFEMGSMVEGNPKWVALAFVTGHHNSTYNVLLLMGKSSLNCGNWWHMGRPVRLH